MKTGVVRTVGVEPVNGAFYHHDDLSVRLHYELAARARAGKTAGGIQARIKRPVRIQPHQRCPPGRDPAPDAQLTCNQNLSVALKSNCANKGARVVAGKSRSLEARVERAVRIETRHSDVGHPVDVTKRSSDQNL